jgi:carbon-monoxide dehydrogenase medium subunit
MYDFNYHRPGTLDEVAGLLASHPDAKLLAGGQTLLPTMKARLASPSDIIDLGGLKGLSSITLENGKLVIGALARHGDVAASEVARKAIPAVAYLAGIVGDPAVRSRGTIGGSIANNDPAADYPAACLALGATITTTRRDIAAEDYFVGLFETALEEGEVITKVSFPIPAKAAYEKFRNPASRYALVGVFVAKMVDGVRVAVTGAGAGGVFRASDFEAALTKDFSAKALESLKIDASGLNGDIHADSDYRAHLIGVMARRAVEAAAKA